MDCIVHGITKSQTWQSHCPFIFFHFFEDKINGVLRGTCSAILMGPRVMDLEKAVAPHFSTLAWKIPWMGEPGRLQSMGSLRV